MVGVSRRENENVGERAVIVSEVVVKRVFSRGVVAGRKCRSGVDSGAPRLPKQS